jgi:hypothetical protein
VEVRLKGSPNGLDSQGNMKGESGNSVGKWGQRLAINLEVWQVGTVTLASSFARCWGQKEGLWWTPTIGTGKRSWGSRGLYLLQTGFEPMDWYNSCHIRLG